MEYLKLFENHSQYEDFIETKDFIKPNVSYCIEQEEVHYNPFIHDYSKDYLTFVAREDNVSFGFLFGNMRGFELSYSLDDGSTWNIFEDQEGNTVTINRGEKILWKGQFTPTRLVSIYAIGHFLSDGPFDVMGNIMSLVSSDDFIDSSSNCPMSSLFRETDVVNANNLILTVTNDNCYSGMFEDCTNLITPPKLPTTLAVSCYSSMFAGCTSLTTAPELLASTLVQGCYARMFRGCTNLNYIKCLAIDISAFECTLAWVQGVAENGTFIEDCDSNFSEGINGIPENWNVDHIEECPK